MSGTADERTAAEEIWYDLADRSGFGNEVDDETRDEIIGTWDAIIDGRSVLGGRGTLRSRIDACLIAESKKALLGSTPDTILAAFLAKSLDAYDRAIEGADKARDVFYGRKDS